MYVWPYVALRAVKIRSFDHVTVYSISSLRVAGNEWEGVNGTAGLELTCHQDTHFQPSTKRSSQVLPLQETNKSKTSHKIANFTTLRRLGKTNKKADDCASLSVTIMKFL